MSRIVLVCGDPIQPKTQQAQLLAERGYMVRWKGQSVTDHDRQHKIRKGYNPVLLTLHEAALKLNETDWLDPNMPTVLPRLEPLPERYLDNFGRASRIVLADPRLTLFLRDWDKLVDKVIFEITDTEWQVQQISQYAKIPYWDAKMVCSKYRARLQDWYQHRRPLLDIETHISGNAKELLWV